MFLRSVMLIVSFCCLCPATILFSQDAEESSSAIEQDFLFMRRPATELEMGKYSGCTFRNATLLSRKKQSYQILAFLDQDLNTVVMKEDKRLFILLAETVSQIELQGEVFVPIQYYEDGNLKNTLARVIQDGSTQLLKRNSYFLKDTSELYALQLKNKQTLIQALNKNSKAIKSYLRSNKVRIKREKDLKALFKYYNQL